MSKFNIGDVVYRATSDQKEKWVTCPECLESGRLRVILGDGSEVSIECTCCQRGYEGSPGKISTYSFSVESKAMKITGVESRITEDGLKVRYSSGYWSIEERDVFSTPEEANERAKELVVEHKAEEIKRIHRKEKDTKSWAWNVKYWRSEIRRAQETISRAQARLNVAPKNVKEADEVTAQ